MQTIFALACGVRQDIPIRSLTGRALGFRKEWRQRKAMILLWHHITNWKRLDWLIGQCYTSDFWICSQVNSRIEGKVESASISLWRKWHLSLNGHLPLAEKYLHGILVDFTFTSSSVFFCLPFRPLPFITITKNKNELLKYFHDWRRNLTFMRLDV